MAIVFGVVVTLANVVHLPAQEIPDGFQKLLPRGGIPAIDNPKYVTADKAKISDRACVFGVSG